MYVEKENFAISRLILCTSKLRSDFAHVAAVKALFPSSPPQPSVGGGSIEFHMGRIQNPICKSAFVDMENW